MYIQTNLQNIRLIFIANYWLYYTFILKFTKYVKFSIFFSIFILRNTKKSCKRVERGVKRVQKEFKMSRKRIEKELKKGWERDEKSWKRVEIEIDQKGKKELKKSWKELKRVKIVLIRVEKELKRIWKRV